MASTQTKILLVWLLVLFGGTASAQQPSGICESTLLRMQAVLDKRAAGDASAGLVPWTLWELEGAVSVVEDQETLADLNEDRIGNCFHLSGTWHRWTKAEGNSAELLRIDGAAFPKVQAYVFFKKPTVANVWPNLSVGQIVRNGINHHMGLRVKAAGDDSGNFAGVSNRETNRKIITDRIIWLDRTPEEDAANAPVEVVICEGSCSNIPSFYGLRVRTEEIVASPLPSIEKSEPAGADESGPTGGGSAGGETKRAPSLDKIKDKIKAAKKPKQGFGDIFKTKSKKIPLEPQNKIAANPSKNAAEDNRKAVSRFINSKVKFVFETVQGEKLPLGQKDLISKRCRSTKFKNPSVVDLINHAFDNGCISLDPKTGYEVVMHGIGYGETLTVAFILKRTKPQFIAKIKVKTEMEDGSPLSNRCFLAFNIVPQGSNEPVFSGTFPSSNRGKTKHAFITKLRQKVTWQGNDLLLKKHKKPDCQPKSGEIRIPLTEDMIARNGVIKVPSRILLQSTRGQFKQKPLPGKVLLVLNTVIGREAVNTSNSTSQFYALADDNSSRELLTEIVSQTLRQLHGKISGLTVGLRRSDKWLDFTDFSLQFEQLKKNKLAKSARRLAQYIVDRAHFVEGNFSWETTLRAMDRSVPNPNSYKLAVFIGQSGLPDKVSYCDENIRKMMREDKQLSAIIFDFATIENVDDPSLAELHKAQLALPAKLCTDNARHAVFFPQYKKSGWERAVLFVLKKAFKMPGENIEIGQATSIVMQYGRIANRRLKT